MSTAFSTYLRDSILSWFRGTAFPTAPTTVHFSAHTAAPGRNGTAADATSTVRPAGRVAFTAADWEVPSAGSGDARRIRNDVVVSFGTAATATTAVTHLGIWDAATGGNFLASLTLTSTFTVVPGSPFDIAIDNAILQLP